MRFTKTIASASVAAVLGLAGVSVAGAASTTGSTPSPSASSAPTTASAGHKAANKANAKAARRAIRRKAGVLIAKTIGITPAALRTELKAGKTIAAIATEHGVQPQKVIDALESAATARINKAVAAGKITAARGTRLETRIDKLVPKIVNNWHPRAAKG